MALIENSFPPLPILKFSFLGCWVLQTRTDPLPPMGPCLAHLLKGSILVFYFTAEEWEERRDVLLIAIIPVLKNTFLLSNFTLMSH